MSDENNVMDNSRDLLNKIYDAYVEKINLKNHIIDVNNSSFLNNDYRKNNISDLPIDEPEAYTFIQNLNKTIFDSMIVLEFRINNLLLDLEYNLANTEEDRTNICNMYINQLCVDMNLLYASVIMVDFTKIDTKIKDYHFNKDKIYDTIDVYVKEAIEKYPECNNDFKRVYRELSKQNRNIFKKIRKWFKTNITMFKIYGSWLFADPEVQFSDIVNKYSPYPIDETRKEYGKIFNRIVDKLKYATDKLNAPESILTKFIKYSSSDISDYFSYKFKNATPETQFTEEEIEEYQNEANMLLDTLTSDLEDIKHMRTSVVELNKFIQNNLYSLIMNYQCFSKK